MLLELSTSYLYSLIESERLILPDHLALFATACLHNCESIKGYAFVSQIELWIITLWWEVRGWIVHGVSCQCGELYWGEMSMGVNCTGANCTETFRVTGQSMYTCGLDWVSPFSKEIRFELFVFMLSNINFSDIEGKNSSREIWSTVELTIFSSCYWGVMISLLL